MNKNSKTVVAIVGGILVLGFFAKKAAADVGNMITDPNAGTDFEGTGIVGTVGNVVNAASGGLFAQFGSFIARTLDPNENKTLDELTGT